MKRVMRLTCASVALAVLAGAGAAALGAARPSPSAAKAPAEKAEKPAVGTDGPSVKILTQEEKVQRRFETLATQYKLRLESQDWILRCLAVISMGRLPTEDATETILARLLQEEKPVGKLVAWQALLSRARLLSDAQYKQWEQETWKMVDKDLFNGDLRIGLLEMLSATPIDRRGRAYFTKLFGETNSLDSADMPTLIAMGRALKAWGDADLVTDLVRVLGNPNSAIRAELILQAAEADVPWTRSPKSAQAYGEWWKGARDAFTANPPPETGWKKLKAQFLEPPVDPKTINLEDRKWFDELELGRLELQNFDFAIAIDCSRSMRPEIERLKRDLAVMVAAFQQVAREPRIGLTLFAPGGIVECLPLTANLGQLGAFLSKADIMGPPGEEEWAGALHQTMTRARWVDPGEHSRRFIVLMSDEPITRPQAVTCWTLAKAAGEAQFRIYGVMVKAPNNARQNPLSVPFDRTAGDVPDRPQRPADRKMPTSPPNRGGSASWAYYDDIADLTDAMAIQVEVPQGGWGLGFLPTGQMMNKKTTGSISPVGLAPLYVGGGPTNLLLTMVLRDAINPQYANRVEPFAKILVAWCQNFAHRVPERRAWGQPDKLEPNHKPFTVQKPPWEQPSKDAAADTKAGKAKDAADPTKAGKAKDAADPAKAGKAKDATDPAKAGKGGKGKNTPEDVE